jgi:hypothetical protein
VSDALHICQSVKAKRFVSSSKLSNLNLMLDNVEVHKKAMMYACKVCILNVKKKGVAPVYIMKIMKEFLETSKRVQENPAEFKISENLLEDEFTFGQEGSSSKTQEISSGKRK